MESVVNQSFGTPSQVSRRDVMPCGARLRLLALLVLLPTFLALSATPALALPTWGIEMTHENAYGAQGGVDPYTGSGTTFARESGFNTYTIKVKNTAPPSVGASITPGTVLTCEPGKWEGGETFTYHWLRNGTVITEAGAESDEYEITTTDEGAAIQCQVTDTNASSALSAASPATSVSPAPSTLPPVLTAHPEATGEGAGAESVEQKLKCTPGGWEGSPTFSYHWLRNGTVITEAGAESDEYEITAADEGTAMQCQVTATNAGGSVVADGGAKGPILVAPEPSLYPPYTEYNPGPTVPAPQANETRGPISVVDQLPAGMVVAGKDETEEISAEGWSCAIATGARAISCARKAAHETLAPGAEYPPITVHVHVGSEVPTGTPPNGGVTNLATVYGGGASPASATASDPTTIAPAVPFGIQTFTTSVADRLGNPFTQAGGHPFSAATELVLNYTTDNNGNLATAGGGAKEVQVELPPGFIGNPQSAPQCPGPDLEKINSERESACPLDTAVGFTHVELLAGDIVAGQAQPFNDAEAGAQAVQNSSLVYNLETTPGHPAAFGFVVGGRGFVLEAKVRSDGNYGITVGDSAVTASPRLLAVKLAFCESGAGGASPNFSCNTVSPSSKAFLTSPTQCTGAAPVSTVRSDSWNDPADYVSKTVYTGTSLIAGAPSASESFVTGCNLLQFEPEVELKPSSSPEGGATQADQPTGATFDLKVPQTSEAEAEKPATPELKDATVSLPAGMSVDPSAADGLQACSNAQFGLGSSVEPALPGECPLASQIGTMEIFEPLLSGAPRVYGPAKQGEVLSCLSGVWNGSPQFSYQWLRGGVPIPGASSDDYVLVAADEGKDVQCQVTAANAGGSSVEVDRVADVIAPEPAIAVAVPPASLPAPSGSPSIGGVLSCDAEAGSWSGSPAFSYQWLRGGQPIAGASGSEYTLAGEDAGETVQCEVVATTGGGVVVDDSAAVIVAPSPAVEPPLLGTPIHGKLFLGEPLCGGEGQPACEAADASNGKLFRLFLEANDPTDGVIIKIPGSVAANTQTGQLTATFTENPQLPFEELKLKLNGGPRAPLASPQTCGTATTSADLTPWSTPGLGGLSGTEPIVGTPDAFPSSSFNVDWNGGGGACPSSLPFAPVFSAGMASTAAGVYSPLTVQFSREDREQDLAGITVHTPVGVLADLSGVPLCGEPQASQGTCAAASQIGSTSTAVGPG